MRVNYVKSARKAKAERHCEKCGKAIEPGMAYKFVEPRYGPQRNRCADCPGWRPSELTGAKIATAYAAQETAEDGLGAIAPEDYTGDEADLEAAAEGVIEDIKALLDEAADGAEECQSDYDDGLSEMPDGLRDSDTGMAVQEKMDALEQWASDLRDFSPDAFDPEAGETFAEWLEGVVGEAQDLISGLEA
jgi:hypothetical protein